MIASFSFDWSSIAHSLLSILHGLIMAVLGIIAFSKSRAFGKPAISAGIAFTMLALMNIWNVGLSILIPVLSIDDFNVVNITYLVSNFFNVLVNVVAIGLLFKAIFLDRSPMTNSERNQNPHLNNKISPLDDGNPYSAPKN